MIKNLNKLSFANYGSVLGGRQPKGELPTGIGWKEATQTIHIKTNVFRYAKDAIYIDFESGMTILRVKRRFGPDTVKAFYLDKPVRIDGDILFQVVPFDSASTVKLVMPLDTVLSSVKMPELDLRYTIESHMELSEIYTLFYQEKEKGFYFKGEAHNQYELTYTDAGRMHSVVNGQDYVLEQGDLMLYGPRQWHMQYAEQNCHACFITISFNWDCRHAKLLLNKVVRVETRLANILKKIIDEQQKADCLSDDLILCYLKEFLLQLIRRVSQGGEASKVEKVITVNSESHIIDCAINFIEENLFEKISVPSVAQYVNVSSSYLSALFQRHLDVSPSEYIRRKKLEESKRLIKEGDRNFTEIAEILAYNSVHHFSNQFKSYYGVTPTEYSRSVK
ncbi:MAG: AraC family transcriptional regulator [Ruthenibacterium sp.]